MAEQPNGPRRWLAGFVSLDWRNDEQAYAQLLDALTRDRLEAEAVELAMDTAAEKVERDELAEARRELDGFRAALDDAHQRSGTDGQAEVAYDSREPRQDAAADLLIQYLVRPGYAEVRTDEPETGSYVYYIRVDWPKLRRLAEEQGHPLAL